MKSEEAAEPVKKRFKGNRAVTRAHVALIRSDGLSGEGKRVTGEVKSEPKDGEAPGHTLNESISRSDVLSKADVPVSGKCKIGQFDAKSTRDTESKKLKRGHVSDLARQSEREQACRTSRRSKVSSRTGVTSVRRSRGSSRDGVTSVRRSARLLRVSPK